METMNSSSEIYSQNLLQIRTSSERSSDGVGKSVNQTRPRVSRNTKDMNRLKRVRFADPDTVSSLSYKPDASLVPAEVTHVPRFDDPKTSEYAYFKKLKENAGRSYHFHPLHNHDNQFKNSEASNCTREMSNMADKADKQSCEELRSFPIQKVTPIDLRTSVSPLCDSKNSGDKNRHEEVFSRKRCKLHQWVADSLSSQPDMCCSRGYDLVSVLLQRLVSDNNESNSFSEARSSHIELHNKPEPRASPDLDIHFDKGCSTERGSLAYWSNSSKDAILSTWDSADSFSTVCADKLHHQYRREPEYVLDGGSITGFLDKSASDSGINHDTEFSFEKYGPLALHHLPNLFSLDCSDQERLSPHWNLPQQSLGLNNSLIHEEQDEMHDPNNALLERNQSTLFLGWDGGDKQNEPELSHISHYTLLNLDSTWSPSQGTDHWRNMESKLDSSGLFPSSYTAINQDPNLTLFSDFHSESNHCHDIGNREYLGTGLDHLSLALSCTPNYLAPSESSLLSSSHYHHGYLGKIFSEKHHPGLDALLLSSGLDSGFERKGLPPAAAADFFGEIQSSTYPDFQLCRTKDELKWLDSSSHKVTQTQFIKDVLNFSTVGFQISVNKDYVWPMISNRSSWDGSEGEETCSDDDGEGKYI